MGIIFEDSFKEVIDFKVCKNEEFELIVIGNLI